MWEENFMSAAILVLQWQRENYYKRKMLNFPQSKLYTLSEKRYITKGILSISKNILSAERCGEWAFGKKIS